MARARKRIRRAAQAKPGKPVAQAADLVITHRHAAGIDIHAAEHFVAVAPEDVPAGFVNPDRKLPAGVRKFGSNTADLEAVADWLKACRVTTVVMESTGVYWIPLYDRLASRGFEVLLVDPRQTKHAPGRPKTDVVDCQWIRRLHSYGLLTGSFRPGDEIVCWRGFQRQRETLIRYAAQHVQHMPKMLSRDEREAAGSCLGHRWPDGHEDPQGHRARRA